MHAIHRVRRLAASFALLASLSLVVGIAAAAPGAAPQQGLSSAPPSAPPAVAAAQANVTDSFRPLSPMPRPGNMPSGSFMRAIQDRGRLIVGVSADTLLWGFADPNTGEEQGFDIDIAKEVAAAIFGTADGHIEYRVLTSAQRIPAVKSGQVDMVIMTMTINAARWQEIYFSEVYYSAGQKVLVNVRSSAQSVDDLSGKTVCAAAGSTSVDNLAKLNPQVKAYAATNWTDCLALLQLGRVDAVSTDDAILAGLQAQDPQTKIIGERLTAEPYGIGISQQHEDFVRFVNGVLQRVKTDGTWTAFAKKWLSRSGTIPEPPQGTYRD